MKNVPIIGVGLLFSETIQEGFNPKDIYQSPIQTISHKALQTELGKVSNLITAMALNGATRDELKRAIRHSMVVIDAEKYQLDYKQSAIDHGIPELQKKYQSEIYK